MDHISLSDLNDIIGKALAEHLQPSYWVVAEIGDLKVNQKGHCYLELVEKEGDVIQSKMRGTIWSFTYRKLSVWFQKFTGQPLQAGLKILFNATIQYHPVYGLSLNIRDIDAQYTLGERAKRRAEVIERLKDEGVFEMNRETTLPVVPQNIAVISSPTAAGWEDFTKHIKHNEYGYHLSIDLFPAMMQGPEAAQTIVEAMLQVFNKIQQYDLLVIIRGGGAALDLDCFDSYDLASHIAQFPIPVVTGIGHERDETVADLVAHTPLKTPTAVAEFILAGMSAFEEKLAMALERMTDHIERYQLKESNTLERITRRLIQAHASEAAKQSAFLEKLRHEIAFGVELQIEKRTNQLIHIIGRIRYSMTSQKEQLQGRLDGYERSIQYLDPKQIFQRGYTLTLVEGKLLRDAGKINPGDAMQTIDGKKNIMSQITDVKNKK
jgi:exodeoxyribonuclease VII large subunit